MSRKGTSVERQITEMMAGYTEINTDYKKLDAQNAAREAGAKTSHEIAGSVKITQSETYKKYKGIYMELGHFVRSEGLGNDLMKSINPESVRLYLDYKLDEGLTNNALQGICSAVNKLDNIMNNVDGGQRDWSGIVQECRDYARSNAPDTSDEVRRYENPTAVIDAIADDRCKLAAEIQYATGLRVSDAILIRINPDDTVSIVSKAGYRDPHYDRIPQDLMDRIKAYAGGKDMVRITTYSHYAYELRKACNAVGEHYTGTHAWRHTYANESYHRHRAEGMSHDEARAAVSKELFHERLDVVDRYIGL